MGKHYNSDGEVIEHVGMKETCVVGPLDTDRMGRNWIRNITLPSLLPEAVDYGDEYDFRFTVHVYEKTGETR